MSTTQINGSTQIQDNSIPNVKLVNLTITNAKISATAAIDFSKLATLNTGQIVAGNGGVASALTMGGDATIDNAGNLTISANVITGSMIQSATVTDANLQTSYIKADGTRSLTGDWNVGGFKLTNLATPTNPGDAANKSYVDLLTQGVTWKQSVELATTAALPSYTYANGASGVGATLTATANGALSIDGTPVSATVPAQRVLVKDEVGGNAPYNGIYTVTQTGDATHPYILTRAVDFDEVGATPDITEGSAVFVVLGPTNADTGWILVTTGAITVGTTPLLFTQFTGLGTITAGAGLTTSGSTISVLAGQGISLTSPTSNAVNVKADTTTVSGTIANAINVSANGVAVKIDGSTIQQNGSSQLIVNGANVTNVNASTLNSLASTDFLRSTASSNLLTGNVLTINSGATLDVAAGATFQLQGVTLTATSGELNALGNIYTREKFSGDGATTTFTLSHTPVIAGSECVYLDGLLQDAGALNDYTIVNATGAITFNVTPESGAKILVNYRSHA